MNTELFSMNRFTIEKGGSERGELLDKFLERLNPPRVAAGFRKLSHGFLAKKLEGVPTDDLYAFYKECERAHSFSRWFWYKLRPNSYTHERT